MTNPEPIFAAVTKVTGVSKAKMLSKSRKWPVVEARMLFTLLASKLGQKDHQIAWLLKRARPTILHARHHAQDYITLSKSFCNKFNKITLAHEKDALSL